MRGIVLGLVTYETTEPVCGGVCVFACEYVCIDMFERCM